MSQFAFTERDQEIMIGAMLCLKSGEMDVDIDKLAKMLKSKNRATANTAWYRVHKKIKAIRLPGQESAGATIEVGGDDSAPDGVAGKGPAAKNGHGKKASDKRKKANSPDGDEAGASSLDEAEKNEDSAKNTVTKRKKKASPGNDEDSQ